MADRIRYVLVALALTAWAAHGETVYVTDRLLLSLHEEEGSRGKQLKTLSSGTALEVLERTAQYARVRTTDGLVGWTKSAFLVEEKPAKLLLPETEAKVARLSTALEDTSAELTETRDALEGARQTAQQEAARRVEETTELADLRDLAAKLQARVDSHGSTVPAWWLLGAGGACLLAGFVGGIRFVDFRSRRRHGGFRVY